MRYHRTISMILLIMIIGTGLSFFNFSSVIERSIYLGNKDQINDLVSTQSTSLSQSKENFVFNNKRGSISNSEISSNHQLLETEPSVGDTRLFWVYNVADEIYEEINATLRVNGSYCYIYSNLTDGEFSLSILQAINNSFETNIYPTLTEFFGSPPDIDSNGRIIILILDIIDDFGGGAYVAGFFDPLHQYLNSDIHPNDPLKGKSGESEILHIDGNEGKTKLSGGNYDVIAHEFQHLIHFGNDDDEHLWLDEGASMFSEYLIGEDPFLSGPYKPDFIDNPDVSLTYWDYQNVKDLVFANYGAAYAFYLYLAEKYGGSPFIQDIVNRTTDGISSVEDALTKQGNLSPFEEVFRNWTIANFLDDTSFANGVYGYYNTTITMTIESTYSSSTVPRTEKEVPYWGTDYLQFENWNNIPFYLEFQGNSIDDYLVTVILTNTTTSPLDTIVIPVYIQADGFGNFSLKKSFHSADQITLAISSYIKGSADHSDDNPAPEKKYWIMINPEGIFISSGNLILANDERTLDIKDVVVSDKNSVIWKETEADGAIFEILTTLNEPTNVNGNLTFNAGEDYWEAIGIDISDLPNGDYKVKYYFYNATASGIAYSEIFTVSFSSPTQSSSTTTTKKDTISGFLIIISLLSLSFLIFNHKKKR